MQLPQSDQALLEERGLRHTVTLEANMLCVVLPAYAVPGYTPSQSDLLLRLSPGYPDIAPDMWWFSPPIRPVSGRQVACTESMETYLGRTWQRWSRHFPPGQWRSGIDTIESLLALIHTELSKWK